jgi:hypothetical protein
LLGFVLVGACTQDDENNTTPTTDAGAADAAPTPDATADTGRVYDRELVDYRPLAGIIENRLEDPNFTMRSDAWFGADERGAAHRLQRAFLTDAPDNRPVAGVSPRADAATPVCALGRMLWGANVHDIGVWITGDTNNATVSVIGISPTDNASWMRAGLSPTGDTLERGQRTWTRFEASVTPYYGWGFLEICAGGRDAVWAGAPDVREAGDNALSLTVPWRPAPEVTTRIEAFEQWRKDRAQARIDHERGRGAP